MTAFDGFPPETIRLLGELQANNRKDWFDAHRSDYEACWLAPASTRGMACGARWKARTTPDQHWLAAT